MKQREIPKRRWPALALAIVGLAGCGGSIQFADTTPIVLSSPVPPPPPPPAPEPPRVEVKQDRIEINEKIQFAIDKADILPASHGLLDEVVGALRDHAEIKKLHIIGHTDDDGDDKYNQGLSDRRAKSVMAYLVQHGIDAARLVGKGMGESQPIADNTSVAGREQNRRVEFLIVEQEGAAP
jgi:outer membrane protein OmpA-like peptidoglycan-associated protein